MLYFSLVQRNERGAHYLPIAIGCCAINEGFWKVEGSCFMLVSAKEVDCRIKELCDCLSQGGGSESERLLKINKITELSYQKNDIMAGGNGDVRIGKDHLIFSHNPN
jgi:hypothetical protein